MFKPYEEMTEIEKVERAIFLLECTDHWRSTDFEEYHKLCAKLRELEAAEEK